MTEEAKAQVEVPRPKRKGRGKLAINPVLVTFHKRGKTDHYRTVHCFRWEDYGEAWACHIKTLSRKGGYLQITTEWFDKTQWDLTEKPARGAKHKHVPPLPMAPPEKLGNKKVSIPIETKGNQNESPKNAPPPITLDEDETEEIPVPKAEPAPATIVNKPADKVPLSVERPGEYNPLAHKDHFFGKPEDMIVCDDLTESNFIAQQRRNKLAALRAKGRSITGTPGNPIVSGFEP